jgi:hypothetical protein
MRDRLPWSRAISRRWSGDRDGRADPRNRCRAQAVSPVRGVHHAQSYTRYTPAADSPARGRLTGRRDPPSSRRSCTRGRGSNTAGRQRGSTPGCGGIPWRRTSDSSPGRTRYVTASPAPSYHPGPVRRSQGFAKGSGGSVGCRNADGRGRRGVPPRPTCRTVPRSHGTSRRTTAVLGRRRRADGDGDPAPERPTLEPEPAPGSA